MKTDITIKKSDVFAYARKHVNYIADKFSDDWDKLSWTPENIDFTVLPFHDVFDRVVNLLAEYIRYDESASEETVDEEEVILLPLDMPDNWPLSETTVLQNCIELFMAHDIVYKWLCTCNQSLAEKTLTDTVEDGNKIYDSLCRRMRPRREMSDIGIMPKVIVED